MSYYDINQVIFLLCVCGLLFETWLIHVKLTVSKRRPCINLLAPELFFKILAHSVCKM